MPSAPMWIGFVLTVVSLSLLKEQQSVSAPVKECLLCHKVLTSFGKRKWLCLEVFLTAVLSVIFRRCRCLWSE